MRAEWWWRSFSAQTLGCWWWAALSLLKEGRWKGPGHTALSRLWCKLNWAVASLFVGKTAVWFSLVLLPPLSFTVRYSVSTGHGTQAMAGNGCVLDAKGKLFLMGGCRWALGPFALCCHLSISWLQQRQKVRSGNLSWKKCSDYVIVLTPVFDKNWCISKRLWSPHLPNTIQLDGSSRYFMKNIVTNT